MSKIGELLQTKEKNQLANDLHNESKSGKTLEYFGGLMQRKYLFNAIFGIISVGSATMFLNYYFVSNSEFLQLITVLSLSLALFVEFVKYFCLNKFLFVTKNELLAAGASNWFPIKVFGFFTLFSLGLSAFLSIQGVMLYYEQSTDKIAQITQKQVQNIVSLDSIENYFQNEFNKQKTLFSEREGSLNAKIDKLKQESNEGGAWSPIAKSNAKTIALIESQILENQNDFSEKSNQIEKSKESHIAAGNKKNEANRDFLVSKEVATESTKSGYNWAITLFCEIFSLAIACFITSLEYQATKEIRAENPNLSENTEPILVSDSGISLETEVFMQKQKQGFLEKKITLLEQKNDFDSQNFQ